MKVEGQQRGMGEKSFGQSGVGKAARSGGLAGGQIGGLSCGGRFLEPDGRRNYQFSFSYSCCLLAVSLGVVLAGFPPPPPPPPFFLF